MNFILSFKVMYLSQYDRNMQYVWTKLINFFLMLCIL